MGSFSNCFSKIVDGYAKIVLTNGINTDTILSGDMDSIGDVIKQLERSLSNVRFADLCKICDYYFGEARKKSTSHCVYKMPWQGDPRVNIQEKNGKAKEYQVRQVIKALKRLEAESGNKSSTEK